MTHSDEKTLARYARLVPDYDRLHARWLRHAGGHAQCAFDGAVTALARPGTRILDVGCGTGAMARRLAAMFDDTISLSLVDACPQMLARTADIRAERINGRIENLPVPSDGYDLVTCAWALETTPFTAQAIAELLRVARPGRHVCLAFCAETNEAGLIATMLKTSILVRGTGRFLNPLHVESVVAQMQPASIRRIPCRGPAAVLVIEKSRCLCSSWI